MESLRLSFNAVLPIFILMLLGYVLKKTKITDKKGFDTVNRLVFKVFLPVLLFYNVYKTDIGTAFDIKLVCFTVVGIFAVFALGYFAVMLLTKDNNKRGVMLQGFFRSNFALLGIPLIGYIYGDNSGGLSALMLAIVVPLFNVLAVFTLERFCAKEKHLSLLHFIKDVAKNPLIIGCFIGLVFLITGIELPGILEKSVKDVSSVATPLAIIVLGAEFEHTTIKESKKELIITVMAKLVIVPLVMLTAAVLLGIRGEALACVLITFGAPVAVSSFSMVQQMGGDQQLSAHVVITSSALCLVTLFGWIYLLGYLNLL